MFNSEFYPTPPAVIETMLQGETIENKTILEPSAGKGDIVDYLNEYGAKNVLTCEINADLQTILKTKSTFLTDDFLNLKSEQISHIDLIVMNPPFSNAEKHILHALEVAPRGCKIIALCNSETINNAHTATRKELKSIIEATSGTVTDLGQCFEQAERKTGVNVSMIKIQKAGESYNSEFEGFFMNEEPEEVQGNGILKHDHIKELVNRYVAAVKLFDEQITVGQKMSRLLNSFYRGNICFQITENESIKTRERFKKDLQKDAWSFVFGKMNMQKYATKGLREDINKFVEQQQNIPFTMRNIYKMLEIVIGTQAERMDKAILEVFDKLTSHYHENRYNVEGWKTNSHYLINQKFIMPNVVELSYDGKTLRTNHYGWAEPIDDLIKAMCFLTGTDYSNTTPLNSFLSQMECKRNVWYNWGFFEIKAFKKGTMHFKFNSEKLWGEFNQRVSKIKGYPLFEYIKKEERKEPATKTHTAPTEAKVLFSIKVA